MTETTDTTTQIEEMAELPDPWRRVLRIATVALTIALLGIALGGVSMWGWARQVSSESRESDRRSRQTTWDQQQGAHTRCVDAAESRAVTIETGQAQYDGQFRQINGRLDQVDLLESIALLFPPSPVIDEALIKIEAARSRIQADGIQTAAELVEFNDKRPPIDPNTCPPPPAGPRP